MRRFLAIYLVIENVMRFSFLDGDVCFITREKKNTRGLAPSVDSLMYYSLNGVESFLDALKAMCLFYDVFRDC